MSAFQPIAAFQPAAASTAAAPSLFDLTERLETSLRSRHTGTTWLAEVEAKLHAYRACLHRHVLAAEGETGWLAELRDDAPRVDTLARRARRDFSGLDELAAAAMSAVRQGAEANLRDVRHDLRRLVETTRHHRGRCAQLVHEALMVDIGAG
jgi:hypothetical protein